MHGNACTFDASRWDVASEALRRTGIPATPGPLWVSFAAADRGPPGLGEFARAYLGQLPRSGYGTLQTLAQAAGLLSDAMVAGGVTTLPDIRVATLNAACELARVGRGEGRAARLGGAVLQLGAALHAGRMTHASLVGTLRQGHPRPDLDRAGQEASERSARLLPSAEFLAALTEAHRLAVEPRDIVVTRVAAVLLSAAARVNEALALEERPEVERDIAGQAYLGLRWRGSKRSADGVKWIVPAMAEIVRGACADLRRVTQEGRRLKRWYDLHPATLYLPAPLEYLRGGGALAEEELGLLLGPYRALVARGRSASFAEVEACLLSLLPTRMRDAGGPGTHPLLVVPAGTFGGRGTQLSACMFETVRYRHVADALAGALFRRLGPGPGLGAAGRSHSFRHHLVTAALRGGLSVNEAAEWCGHGGAREVRVYDHRTADEMRALVARVSEVARGLDGPLAHVQRRAAFLPGAAVIRP